MAPRDSTASPTSSAENQNGSLLDNSVLPSRGRVLLCEVEPLRYKSIRNEVRSSKDLNRIADSAPIVLGVSPTSPEHVVHTLLSALVAGGLLEVDALEEATNALIGHEPSVYMRHRTLALDDVLDSRVGGRPSTTLLPVTQADAKHADGKSVGSEENEASPSHWHRHILGSGFIIPFTRISGLNTSGRSIVAIARLSTSANLGVANDSMIRFVAIVLGPMREVKETKSPFEIAHTLSSLFQDDEFFQMARSSDDEKGFREAIRQYVRKETDLTTSGGAANDETAADATFARTGRFAGGLIDDIKRRYNPSVYISDWVDGLRDFRSIMKTLSTTVWLYFAIIMPTIAFGALDRKHTDGLIGVMETLISQAFAGIVFAMFAGQPLTIVMTTAPLTVFIDVLYRWCKSLEIPFLPFYAWTGIWTAIILLLLVVTDACYIMKFCGNFTEEIFAALIATLFISEYIKPLIKVRNEYPTDVFLLVFLLATGTFLTAKVLVNFRRSFLTKPIIRDLLSDFGVPIAIITMAAARRGFMDIEIATLSPPKDISLTSPDMRGWFALSESIDVKYIFLALVSGALLATLFFLDQNISSILVNKMENKLKKGPGYYLDLVVVCVIIVVQSLLGLPWTHAALPHSPLHARQLADVEEYEEHGRRSERVIKSRETRWTGLLTHILIGLSILARAVLKLIPLAVLYGFFLFLGFGTLDGNALWNRFLLIFTQPEKYPPNHYVRRVRITRIHLYTFIQILLLIILWFVKSNFYLGDTVFNTGLLFPFIIALFIPVRFFLLPRIFTAKELHAFSSEEEELMAEI